MAKKNENEKVVIDFIGLLESSSVQTSKKTESSIVVTKIAGIALEGMFSEYSKMLEEMIFKGCSWQAIKTGRQAGYWILRLMVASGDVICDIPGCIIDDIGIKRGKENIITAFKIRHQYSGIQHNIDSTVSTNIRIQILKDNNPIDVPEGDDDSKGDAE